MTVTCSACTVIEVEGGKIQRHAGILTLDLPHSAASIAITKRSYGVSADGHSFTLGYEQSQTIIMPDASKCAAVIIIENSNDSQFVKWRDYFDRFPNICLRKGDK
ncbi:hypothetical protein [Sphingomonas elodea]|uniref:hypothetical protein n=1 Tax=Sphingomonas elodea TaxID=179878 RepID=UPI001110A36B|nr:hypothetical protein [Sphingomonas elodea]